MLHNAPSQQDNLSCLAKFLGCIGTALEYSKSLNSRKDEGTNSLSALEITTGSPYFFHFALNLLREAILRYEKSKICRF